MTDPNEEEVFYEKGKTIAKAGIDDKPNPSEQTIPNPRGAWTACDLASLTQ